MAPIPRRAATPAPLRYRFYLDAVLVQPGGTPELETHIEWAPSAVAALGQARARPGLAGATLDGFQPDAVVLDGEPVLLRDLTPERRAHLLAVLALQSGAASAAQVVAFLMPENELSPAGAGLAA